MHKYDWMNRRNSTITTVLFTSERLQSLYIARMYQCLTQHFITANEGIFLLTFRELQVQTTIIMYRISFSENTQTVVDCYILHIFP